MKSCWLVLWFSQPDSRPGSNSREASRSRYCFLHSNNYLQPSSSLFPLCEERCTFWSIPKCKLWWSNILTSNISSVNLLLSLEDSGVLRLGSALWQLLNVLGFVIALLKHNNGFLLVAKCLLRSNKKRNVPFYLSVNKYWTKEPNTGLICTDVTLPHPSHSGFKCRELQKNLG